MAGVTRQGLSRVRGPSRLPDLIRLFGHLAGLQDELFELIDRKIAAMRRADVAAMQECAAREQSLVQRLQEREGLRRQLTDLVGEELALPPGAARCLTVSRLAGRLGDQERRNLNDAAGKLRSAVLKVQQAHRVAGMICREITRHLAWVFAAVRPGEPAGPSYSPAGMVASRSGACLFETIG
ncbi:MAG: flagellar protein FlgN [Planctomycetota bacterium]